MFQRFTTFLILAAITLQGVFGSLQESVVICLGGGHHHEPAELVECCSLECSHHNEWPTPQPSDDHRDDCDCTDIELNLVNLITRTRVIDADLELDAPADASLITAWNAPRLAPRILPAPDRNDDPGGRYRLSVIRITRLLV